MDATTTKAYKASIRDSGKLTANRTISKCGGLVAWGRLTRDVQTDMIAAECAYQVMGQQGEIDSQIMRDIFQAACAAAIAVV